MCGDHLIIAVSDGLGSAAHSEQGSQLACATVIDSIYHGVMESTTVSQRRGCLPTFRPPQLSIDMKDLLFDAFSEARNRLQQHADSEGKALRDFACTLLVAVVTPQGWHTLHIGDGAIVGMYADGSAQTLSNPDNGEYVNETVPLTNNEYFKHLRYAHKQEVLSGIALMSDGVQPMGINYRTGLPFAGFFQPLMEWLIHLSDIEQADSIMHAMLDSDKFRQKSDDDMTLVLAYRDSASNEQRT